MNKPSNYSKQLQTAVSAAESAAEIVQSHLGRTIKSEDKVVADQAQGLVTAADLEAEKAIIERIRMVFPDAAFLAEESAIDTDNSGKLWIIDPLDGTNNFAHGIPHFSVSIAYYENGIAKCGVVVNAANGETFFAEQGRGAWSGEKQIDVNQQQTLESTIAGTGFYYDRGEMMRSTLATMEELFEENIRGIRRFGSAALDLVYVASGRFGAYFEYQLSPWDFAAGKLIVEEAGGRVTDCKGNELNIETSSVLATNGLLHPVVVPITQKHLSQLERIAG